MHCSKCQLSGTTEAHQYLRAVHFSSATSSRLSCDILIKPCIGREKHSIRSRKSQTLFAFSPLLSIRDAPMSHSHKRTEGRKRHEACGSTAVVWHVHSSQWALSWCWVAGKNGSVSLFKHGWAAMSLLQMLHAIQAPVGACVRARVYTMRRRLPIVHALHLTNW